MYRVEAQRKQEQQQPTARHGGATRADSPQGAQLKQLQATLDSAPQVEKQRNLAATINASPAMNVQRKVFAGIHNSPTMIAQRKHLASLFGTAQRVEDEEPLQPKSASASPAQLEEQSAAKPNNTGLPDNLKSGIESLSGMSMDNVKVHYNSSQPAQLNALAYAQGTDIHVAPGQEQHLPHEAWHVVQQAQGRVQPTMQMKNGVAVNDDGGLEREADVMGTRALNHNAKSNVSSSIDAPVRKHGNAVQRMTATVHGTTHLVKKFGKSLMNGEKDELVRSSNQLDVDPNTRIRSRRGPNQELVGNYDKRGKHIYRWFLVNEKDSKDVSEQQLFIREGTFNFRDMKDQPIYSKNLDDAPDKRKKRKGHVAVRFEVWCNSDKDLDSTGHMVMKDYSKEQAKKNPYYAYEQDPTPITPGDKEISGNITPTETDQVKFKKNEDSVEVLVGSNKPSKFTKLDAKNESQGEIEKRLHGQKRVLNNEKKWVKHDPERFISHKNNKETKKRFNQRKWVEILVKMDEYQELNQLFKMRKKVGFYSFFLEARTVLGFEQATRCLSVLEDIAIRRGHDLGTGHAEKILDKFAELDKVTEKSPKHMGEVSGENLSLDDL